MRPLIVLGFSARAAAFSAQAASFTPYAIDLFADRDLAALCRAVKISRYPGDFLAALKNAPQAPWIYTGGLENFPGLVERMAAVRPLLGNGGKVLRTVRNCQLLAEAAVAAGLPFPETRLSSGACVGTCPEEGDREKPAKERAWLYKPRRGSGGLGIREASEAEVGLPPRGGCWQALVKGQSASAVFISREGRSELVGVTRQLVGRDFGFEPSLVYAGSIGPLALREDESAKLKRLADELVRRFGLAGLWNVDFIRTESVLWPLEVNPRYSASVEVLERLSGRGLLGEHVAACEAGALSNAGGPASGRVVGKAVAYAARGGVVLPGFDALIEEWNAPVCSAEILDLPRVGERIAAGQPIATVIAGGREEREVEAVLRERVARVREMVSGE